MPAVHSCSTLVDLWILEEHQLSPLQLALVNHHGCVLENPRGIVDHVIEFKEGGNMLFKKGEVDNALEKYGFGGYFFLILLLRKRETNFLFLA
ncbi:Sperm-associated antigen 1A [Bienertia sinuspersici]